MNIIKTAEWQQIKQTILEGLLRSVNDIKTEGKTADIIALEVIATKIAYKNVRKLLNRIERTPLDAEEVKAQSWK